MGLLERLCTNASLYLLGRFLGVEPQNQGLSPRLGMVTGCLLPCGTAIWGKKTTGVVKSKLKSTGFIEHLCAQDCLGWRRRVQAVCDGRWQKTFEYPPSRAPSSLSELEQDPSFSLSLSVPI